MYDHDHRRSARMCTKGQEYYYLFQLQAIKRNTASLLSGNQLNEKKQCRLAQNKCNKQELPKKKSPANFSGELLTIFSYASESENQLWNWLYY